MENLVLATDVTAVVQNDFTEITFKAICWKKRHTIQSEIVLLFFKKGCSSFTVIIILTLKTYKSVTMCLNEVMFIISDLFILSNLYNSFYPSNIEI